jgi:hypothetical protein
MLKKKFSTPHSSILSSILFFLRFFLLFFLLFYLLQGNRLFSKSLWIVLIISMPIRRRFHQEIICYHSKFLLFVDPYWLYRNRSHNTIWMHQPRRKLFFYLIYGLLIACIQPYDLLRIWNKLLCDSRKKSNFHLSYHIRRMANSLLLYY